MPAQTDDRFLWFFIGCGISFAITAIPFQLHHVRKLTEITHEESSIKRLGEDAEEALKLDTLQKLAAGNSYELRSCAIKIVAERCTKPYPRALLLSDLASRDPVKRDKAIDAIRFLFLNPCLKGTQIPSLFTNIASLHAIVTALVNLLSEHDPSRIDTKGEPSSPSPLLPPGRPPSERSLLVILHLILLNLRPNIAPALAAGLVSRWLARYPFPCALEINGSRRHDVMSYFKRETWQSEDPLMADVMGVVMSHPEGYQQLWQYGLRRAPMPSMRADYSLLGDVERVNAIYNDDSDNNDVFMTDGEDTAGAPRLPSSYAARRPGSSWSRRLQEFTSEEEQALRRRRREAMVISDFGTPLNQDNIIQREGSRTQLPGLGWSETSESIEAQMAQLSEEIEREDEQTARRLDEAGTEDIRTLLAEEDRLNVEGGDGGDGGGSGWLAAITSMGRSWLTRGG